MNDAHPSITDRSLNRIARSHIARAQRAERRRRICDYVTRKNATQSSKDADDGVRKIILVDAIADVPDHRPSRQATCYAANDVCLQGVRMNQVNFVPAHEDHQSPNVGDKMQDFPDAE